MSLSGSEALTLVKSAAGMTPEQTSEVLGLLVLATLDETTGAEILKTWAGRGETGVELAATVRFLRSRSVHVPVKSPAFDLCGTGGSGLSRYNVSTTVAFIAAAAQVPVAKHGNRGSRRPNGSFDLLEALGIPFELSPEQEAELLQKTGLCFLFARTHHPAVARVVGYRKAAGRRTIFNLAGPLANPVPIKHQIIGAVDAATGQVVAEALHELQSEGALVVWGQPGIDEISVTGSTGYFSVGPRGQERGSFETPTHPGLDYATLPAGEATENAQIFRQLLTGKQEGPLLDMVCVNAGAAIDLWNGRAPAYEGEGTTQARTLVRDGSALACYEAHRSLARSLKNL